MGQYFHVVNPAKREYLNPHHFGDGLKAWEICANKSTCQALAILLCKSSGGGGGDLEWNEWTGRWAGDPIYITGDYDKNDPHSEGFENLYDEANDRFRDISPEMVRVLIDEHIPDEATIKYNSEASWREFTPAQIAKATGADRAYMEGTTKSIKEWRRGLKDIWEHQKKVPE